MVVAFNRLVESSFVCKNVGMRTDRGYCCTDLGSEAIGIDFVLFIDFLVGYAIGFCVPIVIYEMKCFGDLSNDEIISNPVFDQTVTSFICFAQSRMTM